MRERPLIALLLVVLVVAVFAQVRDHAFVDYDDVKHIVENPDAAPGLEPARALRVFTRPHYGDFIPLTYLSLQLDRTLFGTGPAGTLCVNVALHAASAVLLFLALAQMTGSIGRSAFVAAVFAVHPLRVESVAWAFERKDVLSGFFGMLALWSYARAVREPRPRGAMAAVALSLAAGLLSKPMLVTLPFVLLLLDFWPLERARTAAVVREKWSLFAIVAAAVAFTLWGHSGASVPEPARMELPVRLGWALDSLRFYLEKTLWPTGLAVYYPPDFGSAPVAGAWLGAGLLVGVTAVALWLAPRHGYGIVGWLWFLGMLVPVSGILQVGLHVRADRYTYLPQIGLLIALTWGGADLAARWWGDAARPALRGVAVAAVLALAAASFQQVRHWRDTASLFEHAVAVTDDNFLAHWRLGVEHARAERSDAAVRHLRESVRIEPRLAQSQFELAQSLETAGDLDAAFAHYERALVLAPDHAQALSRYGVALLAAGRSGEAQPHLEHALEADPAQARTHAALAQIHAEGGRPRDAARHYRASLRLEPGYLPTMNNLAQLLATSEDPEVRDAAEALRLAGDALASAGGGEPALLDTLALAQAAAGRREEAIATATRALEGARARGDEPLAAEIRRNLERYRLDTR